MTVHPATARLLASMPWLKVHGRGVDMEQRGRYYPHLRVALLRSGLSLREWSRTAIHEALHAQRGDAPGVDSICDQRQDARCEQEVARLLIDLSTLAEAAAAYPDDPHRVADELDVEYDVLVTRIRHLHPSERHYLRRRLAHTEEGA